MQPRLPARRGLLTAAVTSGVVIATTVVLWALDVIALPVFLGVLAVVGVAELVVFAVLLRRHAAAARTAPGSPATGVAATGVAAPPGPAGTETRGASTVRDPGVDGLGYDPMERFRPPHG